MQRLVVVRPSSARSLRTSVPDGSLTELIRKQRIDLAIDLHEAAPEYPVVNALVASERSQDIAPFATISLQVAGLEFALEPSPPNFRGLRHREWTSFTETGPFLLETANSARGRLRGRTDAPPVLDGRALQYLQAARNGVLARGVGAFLRAPGAGAQERPRD